MTGVPAPAIITLELPWPPSELSPNARPFWAAKARAAADYRESARLLAFSAKNRAPGVTFPLAPPVLMFVTYVVTDQRDRDFDNLTASLKPAVDGIVEARLIANDSAKVLRPQTPAMVDGKHRGVRITLVGAA